ncbi:SCP2 sterol-binding domain-containing protein [Candidatus Bathyarchaeota archaeon]|nr:SCP2 sterol-binding domain-containing protein [Candidatus Bathyarchaeota archaeon]
MKFLDLDYWRQVEAVANGDQEFGIRAKGLTGSFTFRVTDKADLPPVYVRFDDGRVVEVRVLSPGETTDFSLEGPYEVWVSVNKGEIDAANAIMTQQLRFKGSTSRIIRYGKAFMRLFNLMQKVPVEY